LAGDRRRLVLNQAFRLRTKLVEFRCAEEFSVFSTVESTSSKSTKSLETTFEQKTSKTDDNDEKQREGKTGNEKTLKFLSKSKQKQKKLGP